MRKDYTYLRLAAENRANPDSIRITKSFSDELGSISYSAVLDYIRVAMNGVEQEYTAKSKEAGEKVKQHLSNELTAVDYRYQGSVMTNTHIRGHSDIDLLVISNKFYTIATAEVNNILNLADVETRFYSGQIQRMKKELGQSSYLGNSEEDLRTIRLNSEVIMQRTYDKCNTTHPKAIKITNQNLKRDVDIVVANWYDDVRSIIYEKGINRGIQIYNKDLNGVGAADFPFVSIERINTRSSDTAGRLKKMIRFLKTIKADSKVDIALSSFDINAICYDIEVSKYRNSSFYQLVAVLYNQIKSICTSDIHADRITSVDDREYIFKYNSQKKEQLKLLLSELEGIYIDLQTVNSIYL